MAVVSESSVPEDDFENINTDKQTEEEKGQVGNNEAEGGMEPESPPPPPLDVTAPRTTDMNKNEAQVRYKEKHTCTHTHIYLMAEKVAMNRLDFN